VFDVIAFDADDTLWHNEVFYDQGRVFFRKLFAERLDPDVAEQALNRIEVDNIQHFGYGIKSFVLSMVEAALELTGGDVSGSTIKEVLEFAKWMIHAELELFEGVADVLAELSTTNRLILVTLGDQFEQSLKVARSGLKGYFRHIEILAEKTPESYSALLDKHRVEPGKFLMVGNSLRSDILPVVEIGGVAVHIPYDGTWSHERVLPRPVQEHEYYRLEHIGLLPGLVRQLRTV